MQNTKNILLSLCGHTPQILTETLYCMMVSGREKIHVDEIHVVTTKSGKELVNTHLLENQNGKYYQFCRDYKINPDSIKFSTDQIIAPDDLSDIQNVHDNESFANVLTERVWNLTREPNTRLYCSIAGGRKSMSAYLAMIMQFFARPQDRLIHVIVNPSEFENSLDFYYPPPQPQDIPTKNGAIINTQAADVLMVEIPFIRLRDKIMEFQEQFYSFSEMVAIAQDWIARPPQFPQLTIDYTHSIIKIGEHYKIQLQPVQMALYLFFAENSLARPESTPTVHYYDYFIKGGYNDFCSETFARFIELCKSDTDIDWLRVQAEISKIKGAFKREAPDFSLLEFYLITNVGPRNHSRYGIKLDKAYITILPH